MRGPKPKGLNNYPRKSVDWALLAGLIEGEGCIDSFTIAQRPTYVVRIRLSQSGRPEIPKWIQERFGGNARIRQRPGKQTIYLWEVAGNQAYEVLKGIYPYLFAAKRDQAKVAIALHRRRQEKPVRLHVLLGKLKRRYQ